jgi:hypothetical protein
MDWIDLAQNRDQQQVHVNMVVKLWVPQNVGKFMSGGMSDWWLHKKGSAPWS